LPAAFRKMIAGMNTLYNAADRRLCNKNAAFAGIGAVSGVLAGQTPENRRRKDR